jgi:hypothetical protein
MTNKILDWFSFNESKNYGDLYHSIWRIKSSREIIPIIESILENGIKFSKNPISDDSRYKGFFKFLKSQYFISVTRDKNFIKKYPVTFVLDGESISNNYKIEPFNLNANTDIRYTNYMKKRYGEYENWPKNISDSQYLKLMNARYASEEKIINNRNSEGFLSSKYIKEIIFNKPDQHLIDFINGLDVDIKLTIIN